MRGSNKKDESNVPGPSSSIPRYSLRPRKRVDDSDEEEMEQAESANGILKRMQQPCVYVNSNLKKIKMEEDYVPIPKIKDEPVSDDDEEQEQQQVEPLLDKNQSCSHKSSQTGEDLNGGLEALLDTLEVNLIKTQVAASKIPSRQNLVSKIQKIREDLDTEFNGREQEEEQSNVEQPESQAENQMNGAGAGEIKSEQLTNPMLNEKFVNSVLKYLDRSSLKSCRLISKLWDEKASKILFEKSSIRIPSNFYADFNLETKAQKVIILDELKERFSRFGGKSNVVINSQSDFNVFNRLKMFGEEIQNIKINLWEGDFHSYAPGLETIVKKCPNLIFLDVQQEEDTAVNSKVKKAFGVALMTACGKYRHLGFTVSQLIVHFGRRVSVSIFRGFACSGVRVNDLAISYDGISQSDVVGAAKQILESSKDNLEKLSYTSKHQWSIVHRLRIPVLPNLHTLEVSFKVTSGSVFFHPRFRFSKHLPNLKTISVLCSDSRHLRPNANPFESAGPAPSVKKLQYIHNSGLISFKAVLKQFNELEELSYSTSWNRNRIVSPIWKNCSKLKKLTIFGVPLYSAALSINLLAWITGIDKKELKRLWDSPETPEEVDSTNIIESRTGPSILDLQGFQSLILKLSREPSEKEIMRKQKFLSLLRKLTSDAMPNLQITVEVGKNK